MDSQQKQELILSFEFYPPRTQEGEMQLAATAEALAALEPRFFSVTFGAGGSTRDRTFDMVNSITDKTSIPTAPHLSCICSTQEEIREMLKVYQEKGIQHVVALRGDKPSGLGVVQSELRYANELVEFIRQETGEHFHIEVACYPEFHPQAQGVQQDLENFKRKVDAGANSALTQYFYNPDAYFRFVEYCEKVGIDIPIVPGVMPITNCKQLTAFSDQCGAEIPRWIRKRLEEFADDKPSFDAFAEEVVTAMCQELLEGGAPGLHFYTLNRAEPAMAIWRNLNLNA